MTGYSLIERWWKLDISAYTLVSFQGPALQTSKPESEPPPAHEPTSVDCFPEHLWWDMGQGWQNTLNNLRLILQPSVLFYLLLPWLLVFDIPCL